MIHSNKSSVKFLFTVIIILFISQIVSIYQINHLKNENKELITDTRITEEKIKSLCLTVIQASYNYYSSGYSEEHFIKIFSKEFDTAFKEYKEYKGSLEEPYAEDKSATR